MRRALLCCLAMLGCSRDAVDEGRRLFSDTAASTSTSNVFTCATCHETGARTRPLPGYGLANVAVRSSYWGGNVSLLFDAVNQCLGDFMRSRPLTRDDVGGRALEAYLATLGGADPTPLPLTVVQNISNVPSGDAQRGATVFAQGCGNCHGAPHTGAGRLGSVVSIIPDETLTAHGSDATTGARPVTIEKVRHGKYFGVGGNMPLYSLEALSDDDLGAVLAYLETFGLPP